MVRAMFKQIGLRQALEAGKISRPMIELFLALLRDTDTMRNELKQGPPVVTPIRGINDSVLLPAGVLESIKPPVFFLWGDGDPMGGAATARAFVDHVPSAELELMPGAGHAVWMDDADHAAAVTRMWLNRP
jgi:pimeloyl-ACP methyl ester carboxylesterase